MSLIKVLEDWSDYDNRKKKKEDAKDFSCSESWEVDYLINKIRKVFPQLTRTVIREAIQHCCVAVATPRPRKIFVECVLKRLGQRL